MFGEWLQTGGPGRGGGVDDIHFHRSSSTHLKVFPWD